MKIARTLGCALLVTGCSSAIALTDGGSHVQHGSRADLPVGCHVLGDVAIGIPPDAAMPRTEEELIILMRNKTYEQGGNFVILDSSEQRDSNEDGEAFYRGRGTSFRCEQLPSAETTGGEEPTGENAQNESAQSDDNSVSDEELLAQ